MVILNSTVSVEDTARIRSKISLCFDVDANRAITDNYLGISDSVNFGYSGYYLAWPKFAGTLCFKVRIRGSRLSTVTLDVLKSVRNPPTSAA